jgi:hypothetical protein
LSFREQKHGKGKEKFFFFFFLSINQSKKDGRKIIGEIEVYVKDKMHTKRSKAERYLRSNYLHNTGGVRNTYRFLEGAGRGDM